MCSFRVNGTIFFENLEQQFLILFFIMKFIIKKWWSFLAPYLLSAFGVQKQKKSSLMNIFDVGIHKIGLDFFKVHVYFWNVEPNLRHQMIIFCSQLAPYYPDIPKSWLILSLNAYTMIHHEVKPNCWQSGECRSKKSFSAPWKWSFSAPKLLLLWSFVTSLVLSVEKFWLHLLVPYEMENFLVLTMPIIFLKSWCNERNPKKSKSGAH